MDGEEVRIQLRSSERDEAEKEAVMRSTPSRVTRTWAKPNNFYIEVKEGRKLRIGRWLLFLLTWSIWPAAEAAPFTDSKLWSILFFRIVGEISLLDCFIVVNLTTDNPDYLGGGGGSGGS